MNQLNNKLVNSFYGYFLSSVWMSGGGLAASADGSFLYVEAGVHGNVDSYRINADGTLSTLAAVPALGAGIEGIVAV